MPKRDDGKSANLQLAVEEIDGAWKKSTVATGSKDPKVLLSEHTRRLILSGHMKDVALNKLLNLQAMLYIYMCNLSKEHVNSYTNDTKQSSMNQRGTMACVINPIDFLAIKFNGKPANAPQDTPEDNEEPTLKGSPSEEQEGEEQEEKDDAVDQRRTSTTFSGMAMKIHAEERKAAALEKAVKSYQSAASLSRNEKINVKLNNEYQQRTKREWKELIKKFKETTSQGSRDGLDKEIIYFLARHDASISSNFHHSANENNDLTDLVMGRVQMPTYVPDLKEIKIGLKLLDDDDKTGELNISAVTRQMQINLDLAVEHAWTKSKGYIVDKIFGKKNLLQDKLEVKCLYTALESIRTDLQRVSEQLQLGFDTSFDNVPFLSSDGLKTLPLATQWQNLTNRINDIVRLAKINAGLDAWAEDDRINQLEAILMAEAQSKFLSKNKNNPNIGEITKEYKRCQELKSQNTNSLLGGSDEMEPDLKPFYAKPYISNSEMQSLCALCKLTESQQKDFAKVFKKDQQKSFNVNYGAWKTPGETKDDNSNKNKFKPSLTNAMISKATSDVLKTFECHLTIDENGESVDSKTSFLELLQTKLSNDEAHMSMKSFVHAVVNKINSDNKGAIQKKKKSKSSYKKTNRSSNYKSNNGRGGRNNRNKN